MYRFDLGRCVARRISAPRERDLMMEPNGGAWIREQQRISLVHNGEGSLEGLAFTTRMEHSGTNMALSCTLGYLLNLYERKLQNNAVTNIPWLWVDHLMP